MPPSAMNTTPESGPVKIYTANGKEGTTLEPPRDSTREIFETVVFVVVLVLMLKLFVAEAFVIPTGSMASTLWGDQVRCTCRECGHVFPINGMENNLRKFPADYLCENCGYHGDESEVRQDATSISSGDRVLVSKYEYHLRDPQRFDVPVFKYPVEPYAAREMQGMNYIKRLIGLGGETVAVFNGDLYTTRSLKYDHIPNEQKPKETDAWQFRYMYPSDPKAVETFQEGKFEIVRKSPPEILAMRRIVFDLDKQPKSRQGIRRVRWDKDVEDPAGWTMETAGFKHQGETPGFVHYQHIDPWDKESITSYLIADYLGYNTRDSTRVFMPNWRGHWVSDLVLDCTADISSPDAEVILELAKSHDRFQAIFSKGQCRLNRITVDEKGHETWKEMGSHATKITKAGKYDLRFANVDCRLTVWVDGKPLGFGKDQSDYPPPDPKTAVEPFENNDKLKPASIGGTGDIVISKVSLWRDLNYTCAWDGRPAEPPPPKRGDPDEKWDERKKFEPEWNQIPRCGDVQTYYVQPGHYLMFGDNSRSSSDSRSWGQVPHRLMLGRAVMIYWPLARMGVIE
ncbi:MAG: S26 family signal peptidase [Planctomycetes bacterium]|nr:S26 family signal peptidase [Planctomycetota bacterium]